MQTQPTTTSPVAGTQATTKQVNYRIYDRTGGGVTQDIYAETLEAAIEEGREWIEDGERIWRTISLPCCVREIVYVSDLRSIKSLPAVYDVRLMDEDRRALEIDVDGDSLDSLVPILDSSVALTGQSTPDSEGMVTLRGILRGPVPQMIDKEATDHGQEWDCTGSYTDPEAGATLQPDGTYRYLGYILTAKAGGTYWVAGEERWMSLAEIEALAKGGN